jgi:prevent-host-death family protein
VRITVTELKNKLSQYLRLVKRGETIEVLEHSIPIARLQRIGGDEALKDERLGRLVRDGVVSLASRKAAKDLLKRPPVPCSGDPAKAVVRQRGDR